MGDLTYKQALNKLIQAGFSFEVNQDKLVVKGDLATLTDDQKLFLKENKPALIALIQNQTSKAIRIQKSESNEPSLLSYSQQGLWLLDKINNGSNQYNITSAFQLKGKLNVQALNKTFLTIIQRHESLRSIFTVNEEGQPIQHVQSIDNFEVDVNVLDPGQDIEDQLIQKFNAEAERVFDLKKDFLISVKLFKQEEQLHFLIINMHHIASDGWSMGILMNEFSILYTSFIKNEPNPLAELPIRYSDYANWQRKWLKGNVFDSYMDYWKNQLADVPLLHNLPLDKARPKVQRFKGSTYTSFIDPEKLNALKKYCQREQASLFMGIHTVFSALLSRYSNEKDIVVGSPVANREHAETAGLVGFFMNLIVLRSDLSRNPGFLQLLRQSKQVIEGAYEFQQMPFNKLVEELKVQRNLSHSPLFQILLTMHDDSAGDFSFGNLTMESFNMKDRNAKYDLSLDVYEGKKGLQLVWEYNTDLFEEQRIVGLAFHFDKLLSSMLARPEENVLSLDLVGDQKNEAYGRYLKGEQSAITLDDHVLKGFQHQLKTKPADVAVIYNGQSYTYKDLGERVDFITQALIEKGIKPTDKVGLCLLRTVDLVASIFACFKLGAAYIPLDPVYPADRLAQIIHDAQPQCIVSLEPLKKIALKTDTDVSFIYLDKLKPAKTGVVNVLNVRHDLDHTAYIIFTSGTTGKPKGIELTQLNLANLLKGFDHSFGQNEQQRWLAQTSINFDISVLELIWTISRGHQLVLQPSDPMKFITSENPQEKQDMNFSIMFFGADKRTDHKYDLLLETAKYADEHDFTAIWTPERHFGEFGGAFPSPSVLSSALAVLTKKLQIRSGSVVLPLHDPIRVAEEWSIVDNLSNGRVGLSIASGWHPNDFVFYHSDYQNRKDVMQDKIAELKNLWKGIPIKRENGAGQTIEIKIRPKPVQALLPMWITAAGNSSTFEYAGRIGANILTHLLGQSMDQLTENIAVYYKALQENGFDKKDVKITLMLHTYIDASEETAFKDSEQAFKAYLDSSIQLLEPIAKAQGLDINSQRKEIVDIVYNKFSRENTLIGSPESCQKILQKVQSIGVNEIACLVDFGVENKKVVEGLQKIAETKELFQSYKDLSEYLEIDKHKTVLELIRSHEINHIQMTSSQSKMVWNMAQTEGVHLSSVKRWFIGGEAVHKSLIANLSNIADAKFYNMYGPTETTVWSAWREITPDDVQIGGPVLNTELLLLNEFEQKVPQGVVGELYIGGHGLAKGYYNNPELTKDRFKNIENSVHEKARFYKTGDLLRMNQSGTFEYVGRADNQVKINGYRIELEDIEQTVLQIPGVKNCKVLPVSEENQTILSAYIVKTEIVQGEYTPLPPEKQAKPYTMPDGTTIYCQSDRQIGLLYHELMEDNIYFKHGIYISENGVVLDVGANVGGFSMDLSRRHPDATIIAFEPIPQTFSALKQNYEHRQVKGLLYNYGVSNKKESARFFYYPDMSGMSGRFANKETIIGAVEQYFKYEKETIKNDVKRLDGADRAVVQSYYDNVDVQTGLDGEAKNYLSNLYTSEEVECRLLPLSEVIDAHGLTAIDLVKIDVEKSERLVLEGIREEQWKMIRQLVIEVDGDNNLQFITELLEGKGYKINVDELAISDAKEKSEENTYLLYAVHQKFGRDKKENGFSKMEVLSEYTIREGLRQKLPAYMIPKNISLVESIPLMQNGKVDMVKLKSIKSKNIVAVREKSSISELELTIYEIWCEVLKKEAVPYHVSIFEAGGSSIEIVLLHEKLQKHFKIEFSLIELFRKTTLEQQAKFIESVTSQQNESVEDNSSDKAMEKGANRRRVNRKKQTN